MVGIIVVSVIVHLCLWFFIAWSFFSIVQMKGYNVNDQFYNCPYFWWTFLLGIVGILMIIALPDRKDTNSASVVKDNDLPAI